MLVHYALETVTRDAVALLLPTLPAIAVAAVVYAAERLADTMETCVRDCIHNEIGSKPAPFTLPAAQRSKQHGSMLLAAQKTQKAAYQAWLSHAASPYAQVSSRCNCLCHGGYP